MIVALPVAPDGATVGEDNSPNSAKLKWTRFRTKWCDKLKTMHVQRGSVPLCPIAKSEGDQFSIGCWACRAAGLKDAWATYKITTSAQMQIAILVRHCCSQSHVDACKKIEY